MDATLHKHALAVFAATMVALIGGFAVSSRDDQAFAAFCMWVVTLAAAALGTQVGHAYANRGIGTPPTPAQEP